MERTEKYHAVRSKDSCRKWINSSSIFHFDDHYPLQRDLPKNVGEKTFLPKSTLSQAVDGLVRGGLLHREPVEGNRREIQLSITEKGENLLKTIHFHEGSIHQVFQTAIEMLTEEQFEELLKTHLQITNFLEAQATEQGECTK